MLLLLLLPLLQWMTRVSSGFLVLSSSLYVFSLAGSVFLYLRHTWLVYSIVRELEGLPTLLLLTTRRLLEPQVLGLYWWVLLAAQLWANYWQLEERKYVIEDSDWLVHGLVAMSEICESPLVLIATCVVLMFLSSTALDLAKLLLSCCGGQVRCPTSPSSPVFCLLTWSSRRLAKARLPSKAALPRVWWPSCWPCRLG